ncbi:MAG: tetratricopeptide repeat protein, partial [Firmicutes bacterium]|nr:tetratricopeptide repeat protein [Bacillota bacterium]
RHLNYWQEEAEMGGDLKGQLLILNEKIGFYRKTDRKEPAFENIRLAMELMSRMDYDGSISQGTTFTNAATACQNFGEPERALDYFEKARAIYEGSEYTAPELLGGLYNNMALSCVSLKKYDEALELYDKALNEMKKVKGGELEQAITCLNMADALNAHYGIEEAEAGIFELLDRAWDLIESTEAPKDGYYAFVCSKCAPAFSYYGYFMAANELNRRSEEIYERA